MDSKAIINIEVKNSKLTCCENASLDCDSTDGTIKIKNRFIALCCQCLPKLCKKSKEKEMQEEDFYQETNQIQES